MAAGKQLKGKKKWFGVLAPALFNSREIADVPAYSPEELHGRWVEVTGQMLTGISKDNNKKYLLKIVEMKGDKAVTLPAKYYISEGFVQRSARKYKDRFIDVLTVKTKDDKQVVLKLFFFNVKRLHHSVRGEILRKTKIFVDAAVSEVDSVKIFDPAVMDKITFDLKKSVSPIYPLDKIFVTRLALVQAKPSAA